jgi:hypothetical protein
LSPACSAPIPCRGMRASGELSGDEFAHDSAPQVKNAKTHI